MQELCVVTRCDSCKKTLMVCSKSEADKGTSTRLQLAHLFKRKNLTLTLEKPAVDICSDCLKMCDKYEYARSGEGRALYKCPMCFKARLEDLVAHQDTPQSAPKHVWVNHFLTAQGRISANASEYCSCEYICEF